MKALQLVNAFKKKASKEVWKGKSIKKVVMKELNLF